MVGTMTHSYTTYLLGGSKGIALDVAKRLASQKQPLTLIARGASELTAVAKELAQLGSPEVTTISCDLSQPENVDKLCTQIAEDTRHIQGLVNAAGYFAPKAFLDQTRADYRQYLDLNEALFLTTQAVAKNMKAHGGGSIVNIATVGAYSGGPGVGAYGASKAGLINLTRTMSKEFAPWNIRVNAISPGPIRSELTDGAEAMTPGFFERAASVTSMKRVADTEEIIGPVLYLASDASSFVTGEDHVVAGGMPRG